jgi:anti-sigma B factor antagonist
MAGRFWTRHLPGRRGARTAARPQVLPERFDVRAEQAGDTTIVAVTGEVDIATAPSLRAALAGVPADAPLVIDLSAVTFMDSTGLAILLEAVRARGERVAIVCPEGPARLLFAVSGTEDELPLHGTRADAVRAVA